jgi:hypothetical protein
MIERLDRDPEVGDRWHQGLVFCLLEMMRRQSDSDLFWSVAHSWRVERLFPLLFRLNPPFRPFILEGYRHALKAGCSLRQCAVQCLGYLSDEKSSLDDCFTAAAFLKGFLRFFPVDVNQGEITEMCHLILIVVASRLTQFVPESALFLEFISACCFCLTRFFRLDLAGSLGLVEAVPPHVLFEWFQGGIFALRMAVSGGPSDVVKVQTRIVKMFVETVVHLGTFLLMPKLLSWIGF